jgi:hypothetical protein
VVRRLLVPIATAGLVALLMAGCGGGGGSSSTDTTAGGAATGGPTALCDDVSSLQSAVNQLKQLDASTASAYRLKQDILNVAIAAQGLDSRASQATREAQAKLKTATNNFQAQLASAVNQPVSQQLVTVGKAISQFEKSLSRTKAQFSCDQ